MRFPQSDNVRLPCQFTRLVPGALHGDGRRYLPLLVFTLENGFELGVTDRHHRAHPALVGQMGVAQFVFLLSKIRVIALHEQPGLAAETAQRGRLSTMPTAYGRVVAVLTWETNTEHLPYQTLYTELLLDIGVGTIGVRTSVTADDLAVALGAALVQPGDWLAVERSRIDLLNFSAAVSNDLAVLDEL